MDTAIRPLLDVNSDRDLHCRHAYVAGADRAPEYTSISPRLLVELPRQYDLG